MSTHHEDTSDTPTGRRSSRRGTSIGLAVGLLGGTAAGLVFGVPGMTGAAAPDAAAVVQQADDTTDTGDTTDARPEPGVRMREVLQDLVDDGTLTAEQADAVVGHLVANAPERGQGGPGRGGPGGHGGPGGRFGGEISEAVTDLLGVDGDTLREQLRGGETLADIATGAGVDVQTLIDTLVDEAEARVAEGVENGRIDAERAAEITAEIEERVTARVNGERPTRD